MSERSGPKVAIVPSRSYLTCLGCAHLVSTIVKSGTDPDWRYHCNHANRDANIGGLIGFCGEVETPSWCPLSKQEQA